METIKYYAVHPGGWGHIVELFIKTDDTNYISHTTDYVTLKELFDGQDDLDIGYAVTYSRKFDVVQGELINSHTQKIIDLKTDMILLVKSNSYESYRKLLNESFILKEKA